MSIRIARSPHLTPMLLLASALAVLDGCSKASDDYANATPNPTLQAQAVQSSIASAQPAPLAARPDDGAAASGAPMATGAPSADNPPMNMGAPAGGSPSGMARMLGQPPMPSGSAAAGGLPPAMGAPHIYHLGADTFFVDQASAIGLTSEQQSKLTMLKANAGTAFAATQRKIDQGEQDLWVLSSSEAPDIAKIEAKVGEIARLSGQQRIDFIRAVGVAVGVLSDAQRKAVAAQGTPMQPGSMAPGAMAPAPSASGMNMGATPPSSGMPMGDPPKMPKGMKMGGMGGMAGMGDAGSSGGMGHM